MKKPFVAGIAGGSASGKSTFTDRLENTLRETGRYEIKVFHMDDYFKDDDHRPYVKAPITGKMYLDDNHPESIDLPQLRIDLAAAINDNTADIIIVEGLLTLSDDEICQQLDLKLFIECRADERIVRRLKRNMEWDMAFDEIADVYLDMVRYRHDEYVEPSKWKADFILNGSNFSEKALGMIAEAIMSHTLHA